MVAQALIVHQLIETKVRRERRRSHSVPIFKHGPLRQNFVSLRKMQICSCHPSVCFLEQFCIMDLYVCRAVRTAYSLYLYFLALRLK